MGFPIERLKACLNGGRSREDHPARAAQPGGAGRVRGVARWTPFLIGDGGRQPDPDSQPFAALAHGSLSHLFRRA